MARAKYQEWIDDPDKRTLLSGWARKGLSDEQIAKNIGISRSTLNEWRKKYPVIADTLKKSKEIADTEVEKCPVFEMHRPQSPAKENFQGPED